jgi:hypothetical protein
MWAYAQKLPNRFRIINDVVVLAPPVVMEWHQRSQLIHFVLLDWISRFGQIDWSRVVVDALRSCPNRGPVLEVASPTVSLRKDEENAAETSTIGQVRSTTFGA